MGGQPRKAITAKEKTLRPGSASPVAFGDLRKKVERPCPGEEPRGGRLPLLIGLRALEPMQHLVACVHAGAALMLAHERDGVADRADDATVAQPDLRLDAKFGRVRRRVRRRVRHGSSRSFGMCGPRSGRARALMLNAGR